MNSSYEFSENGGAALIQLIRENGTAGSVAIYLNVTDGTAKNDTDYLFGVSPIEFASGQVCNMSK